MLCAGGRRGFGAGRSKKVAAQGAKDAKGARGAGRWMVTRAGVCRDVVAPHQASPAGIRSRGPLLGMPAGALAATFPRTAAPWPAGRQRMRKACSAAKSVMRGVAGRIFPTCVDGCPARGRLAPTACRCRRLTPLSNPIPHAAAGNFGTRPVSRHRPKRIRSRCTGGRVQSFDVAKPWHTPRSKAGRPAMASSASLRMTDRSAR